MWIIFSFIAAIFWGLVLATVKKSYSSFSPSTFILICSGAAVSILFPFALLNGGKLIFWPVLPLATLVAGLFIFEFYVLEKGKLSLTGTVLNTYPLFTVVLAGFFLGEKLTVLSKFGVFLILFGLMLLSLESVRGLRKFSGWGWLFWGLAGAVATGTGDFIIKAVLSAIDPFSYSLAFTIGWLLIAIPVAIFTKKSIKINFTKDFFYLCSGAVFLFLGYIFLHLALKDGIVSIVTPITASSAVLSLFLAFIWLKEKIMKHQLVGALMVAAGVFMVSFI